MRRFFLSCTLLTCLAGATLSADFVMRDVWIKNEHVKGEPVDEHALFLVDSKDGKLYQLICVRDDSDPNNPQTVKVLKRLDGDYDDLMEKIAYKKKKFAKQAAKVDASAKENPKTVKN